MVENNIIPKQVKQIRKISFKDITESAKSELKELTGFDASSVVSVKKEGEEWKIIVELLERAGIPDRMDILGIYEVKMDIGGNLLAYERKGLRKRGDTAGQETEETTE
jgi:hypothetical protein